MRNCWAKSGPCIPVDVASKRKVKYVGTAGWSIPAQYKRALPEGRSHLERYSQRLRAVEINSSFYRHHQLQTYRRWSSTVPASFRFSVKVPRTLTHSGELLLDAPILDRFVEEIRGLGAKLGVILVQLPPKLAFDERASHEFFKALRQSTNVPVVCEPRHPSWGSARVDRLLAKWRVSRVAADPAPWPGADEPGGARRLAYFRLHGQPRKYYSDYDEASLASLHAQASAAFKRASEVWIIFDNTALGHALGNALAVTEAMRLNSRRKPRGTAPTKFQQQ
jgi:uncharacterized protein YecE (DUF72 family)